MTAETQIIDTIGLGDGVIYRDPHTDQDYLVIPTRDLASCYGTFFIQENLLFASDWDDRIVKALVDQDMFRSLKADLKRDPTLHFDNTTYRQLLKVPRDQILPTIAKVTGKLPIEIAKEDFAIDAKTFYQKDVKGETSYIFPY